MRGLLAWGLVLAGWAPAARAGEAPSVGLFAGAAVATGPGRAAPAVELDAALPLGSGRFSLVASFAGWTLPGAATADAATQFVGTLAPAVRGRFADDLSWLFAAGPALSVENGALSDTVVRAGFSLGPGLELATRRRTLFFDLGARAMLFTEGPRFTLVAGASYAFR